VLDLLRGFQGRARLHLATSRPGPLTAAAQALDVPVHLLPSLQRSIDPTADGHAVRDCVALIRRVRPQVVHLHSSKAGLVGRLAGRLAGVPVVFTAHGWGFTPGVPRLRRLVALVCEMLTASFVDRIICVSDFDQQLGRRYLPGSKARLVRIHYGIETDAPQAAVTRDPAQIIMTARFHAQKDQEQLLRAFALLDAPRAELVFVGDGDCLPRSRQLATDLGIAGRAHFLGDRHNVPDLLAQAQIFALATHYEGLPISILEAMRAGLPVVASDVGGVSEEVRHQVTGLLAPRSDPPALAAALQTLLGDPGLRARLGAAGRQALAAQFALPRMLQQTAGVYHDAMQCRPLPARVESVTADSVPGPEPCP
jgi:glycosyltransferase involved in cell wall biosynthesis